MWRKLRTSAVQGAAIRWRLDSLLLLVMSAQDYSRGDRRARCAARHTACVVARRQDAIGQLGRQFDGIFFDTYSEFYEDMRCGLH